MRALLVAASVMPFAGSALAQQANEIDNEVWSNTTLSLIGFERPHDAAFFMLAICLLVVSAAISLFYAVERRRWKHRERVLRDETTRLRGVEERVELLMGAQRQAVLSWTGRDRTPRFEGDATLAGENATLKRLLAFGSWVVPADAAILEKALERLKERGEGFLLTLKTLSRGFVSAEGRTAGGKAILRLCDIDGVRGEILRMSDELANARSDLASMTTLLDSVSHPIWLRDAEDRLVWTNKAYLRAVEAKDIDEARTRTAELLDTTVREEAAYVRSHNRAFARRVAAVIAGERRVLDVSEEPTSGGSAGLAVDVSELEEVRANLQREMEAHVRTLDQLSTAVAIFDQSQRLVFYNAAYLQYWRLEPTFLDTRPSDGEILERLRARGRLPEQADFRAWKAEFLSAYQTAEAREIWWHLPDRRVLRVVSSPNPQGGLTYLFDDVSDRMRLESQMNAFLRVQNETLDALKEGVAVFGSDGRLKYYNRAFADMWEFMPEALQDQPHIDAIITLCRLFAPNEEAWNDIRGAVAGLHDMRLGLSCRIDRTDKHIIDCAGQPLPDGATLLTFADVSASVHMARALTERNEALENASRMRDEFVHHFSYEVRSPLTNVIGFTQMLSDGTAGSLNERQREYAGHIMRSSSALLAILNDILDLASIDAGSMELTPEPVDIRATIDAAARGLEDRLAESSVNLSIDVPADIGTFVADPKRVRQVLFNLMSNAVSFSVPGQTVRVTARRQAGEVKLEVADNGRGIPAEIKARVFERFESNALGTKHRGIGLGLSIVRSLVELHGGHIELVSQPGSGTRVTCHFPDGDLPQRIAAE